MLRNCPILRAAPLILVNLVTNRLTFDSVNINEPLLCDDSSLDTDLRTISEAAPYPSEAARPMKKKIRSVAQGLQTEDICRRNEIIDQSWKKVFWMTSVA